jgi:phage gp29-like protein
MVAKAKPDTVSNVRSADIPDFYERHRSHPGHGLTPKRIHRIFREAEAGFPELQCDLFEDVLEQDAHLRSLFDTRLEAVAGKEWIIQAGGDRPEDIRAAELLETALKGTLDLNAIVEHQLTAVAYGWAASEVIWGKVGDVFAPVHLVNVPHWRFNFGERDEALLRVTDRMHDGIPIAEDGWWFTRRRHRLTVRAGLMRTAIWWSLFKRMAIRDWVSFAERYGLPLAIGKYQTGMPEAEKEALKAAVEMIGRDGYATFNEGCSIEFAKADGGGSGEVHPTLVDLCNAELSKLITGATLTSGEGTSTGSYALGRVHQTVSFDRVVSDALKLGYSFAQQIGRPFLEWNGLEAAPPRLRVNVVPEMDAQQRMALYSSARNELGLELDEDQVRTDFQIKPPRPRGAPGSRAAEIARKVVASAS